MTMSPPLRKLLLTAHVTTSVGWLGALAVFLVHAIASVVSQDELMVRAACVAMSLTAWFVIFPLSVTSLITGLMQALGTAWGLFRHYWVLAKLVLTVLATTILLLKLAPISYLADTAARTTFAHADLAGLRMSVLVHAAGGLLVLVAIVILASYKPIGLTPFGHRQRRECSALASDVAFEIPTMPLWVKVLTVVAVFLIVMIGIMMVAGGHGPGAHVPTDR